MDAIKIEPTPVYHVMALSTKRWAYPPETPSLSDIATEFYGKTYSAQFEGLGNDSAKLVHMDEDAVEEAVDSLRNHKRYLGLPVGKKWGEAEVEYADCSDLEYWLSLRHDPDNPDNEDNPESGVNYFGQSFKYDFQVEREAPDMINILADLIKNGILPYGHYLIEVSW